MRCESNQINTLLEEISRLKEENNKLKKDLQSFSMNNELYKSFFKNNTSPIMLIDPLTGDIIDANQAACDFYIYEINEITKMNISKINILPYNIIFSEMNNAVEKVKNTFCFIHRLSNGELKDVEVKSEIVDVNGKKYLYSIVTDITERKRTERLLEKSEKKYKYLLNNINDQLFFFKIEKNGMPGNFLEVNNVVCNLLEYSYEEMLTLSPFDLDTRGKQQILDMIKDIYESDRSTTFETVLKSKHGKYIPVEISVHVSNIFEEKFILSVARDITKRKKIEKNLIDSIEKERKIMSFLPDAVFIVRKGKIVFINESGVNLLGYSSSEEILKKKYLDIIHPDYKTGSNNRLRQMELGKDSVSLSEKKFLKKDCESIDVEVTGVRIPYEDGNASLIVARDISERKYYKRQLNERIEFDQLRTEFFANISHELRTPLNVILSGLQLGELYINKEVSNRYMKTHKRMKQNCYRLLRLINNIIDITKIDAGYYNLNLENFQIVTLIKDIVSSIEDYVKNKQLNIELKIDIDDKITTACDPEKIERVFLNLLSNAIKFTEPGGKINISIARDDSNIIISLKDSGIGMPEDKIQCIFDRFVQVDKSLTREQEGSGIGLSLVKSIVNLHGGNITVKSQKDRGSEFIVCLPIKESTEQLHYRQINHSSLLNVQRMNIEFSDIYVNY